MQLSCGPWLPNCMKSINIPTGHGSELRKKPPSDWRVCKSHRSSCVASRKREKNKFMREYYEKSTLSKDGRAIRKPSQSPR